MTQLRIHLELHDQCRICDCNPLRSCPAPQQLVISPAGYQSGWQLVQGWWTMCLLLYTSHRPSFTMPSNICHTPHQLAPHPNQWIVPGRARVAAHFAVLCCSMARLTYSPFHQPPCSPAMRRCTSCIARVLRHLLAQHNTLSGEHDGLHAGGTHFVHCAADCSVWESCK